MSERPERAALAQIEKAGGSGRFLTTVEGNVVREGLQKLA
jgi:hypothetical protein